jgi:hypothetical protein
VARPADLWILRAARNSGQARHVESTKTTRRSPMLKGGLLWLIGIPLPIILILFFLGYLS